MPKVLPVVRAEISKIGEAMAQSRIKYPTFAYIPSLEEMGFIDKDGRLHLIKGDYSEIYQMIGVPPAEAENVYQYISYVNDNILDVINVLNDDITNKFIDVEGDIANAKSEAINISNTYTDNTKLELQQEISEKLSSVFRFKGYKDSYEEIEALTDMQVGDVWGTRDGKEYVYTDEGTWELFGFEVDLSNYYTKTDIDNKIGTPPPTANSIYEYIGVIPDNSNNVIEYIGNIMPEIRIASKERLGIVKIGDYIDVNNSGTISHPTKQVEEIGAIYYKNLEYGGTLPINERDIETDNYGHLNKNNHTKTYYTLPSVDDEFDDESTNPVQNKVLKEKIDEIDEEILNMKTLYIKTRKNRLIITRKEKYLCCKTSSKMYLLYKKSVTESKEYTDEVKEELQDEIDKKVSSVLRFKGYKNTFEEVEALTNMNVGDVWGVREDNSEYVYTDEHKWELLGFDIDLSNYYDKSETDDLLNNKVDKINGKGLSTNDYTNSDKDKLDNIESEAQVNVIESISVEGIPQSIDDDKNVDVQLIRADLSTLESELVDIYNNSQPYENAEVVT